AERDGALVGFCAYRDGWLDHLYVHPDHLRRRIGTALLRKATDANAKLQLWTFQRNAGAIGFYESQGFTLLKLTDGRENEEREPDALYKFER
ncbi:MAG TPA: GNAT family N-acetyltransferase, partial [Candidatus Elarobacter sp.]|nr:GNAT family N-acetyltransferase [Candidatus Elarobacter sp.]